METQQDTQHENRIRTFRKSAGFTQQEVSEKSGIPQSDLSAYENGRKVFGLRRLRRLANTLGIPLNDLL